MLHDTDEAIDETIAEMLDVLEECNGRTIT